MAKFLSTIEARVCGIPCLLGVTHHHVVAPWRGSIEACPSDLDYYGYAEIEFDVLDRRGRPAAWLEKKMSAADWSEAESVALEALQA